ncbi:MAG: peptide-methionine (S)-S-oxide reductase [Bacteroidota bacterium]
MMKFSLIPLLFIAISACSQVTESIKTEKKVHKNLDSLQTAYFAAGCFWCVEAIFESIEGVEEVESGYSGGTEKNPTYELVCSGKTKHAETVKIYYDSSKVNYNTLLEAFFGSHDASTLNQQGPDFGVQYRSIVFYESAQEKEYTEKYIQKLLNEKVFPKITTEIVPLVKFYKAEIYHQNYEETHPDNPYVKSVSLPRLNRFKEKYVRILKNK